MANIVDRRLAGKNKSAENREKFKARHQRAIQEAVRKILDKESIKNLDGDKTIKIPVDDDEPSFSYNQQNIDRVFIGNKKYRKGDKFPKPYSGSGSGNGGAQDGEGLDPFEFQLTKEEFEKYLFEELEIPFLEKKNFKEIDEKKLQHSGFIANGVPTNLSIVRSFKNALARQIAMAAIFDEEIELEKDENKLKELKALRETIPFLDDLDLRYKHRTPQETPSTKAVMFLVMDVSGSMDQLRKDLAKRFYILLYLFLRKNYEKFDVVFVKHTSEAKICTEEEFFYNRETGGTILSSALEIVDKEIKAKYSPNDYNIYIAQASDADNFPEDNARTFELLKNSLLPIINMYIFIGCEMYFKSDATSLFWDQLKGFTANSKNVFISDLRNTSQVYPEFVKIFKKK